MVRRRSGQSSTTLAPASGSKPAAVGSRLSGGKPAASPARNAFDVFLDRGLHTMFDSVKDEPIPDELIRIIQEDRKE